MPTEYVTTTITDQANESSLPIVEGSMGLAAVDIQTLFARHGILAYDPGFRSTASCKSSITFVEVWL